MAGKIGMHGSVITTKSRIEKTVQVVTKPNPNGIKGEPWHMERAYIIRDLYKKSGDLFTPCQNILQHCVSKQVNERLKVARIDCEIVIWKYAQFLLSKDFFQPAAILLWGPELFDPRPHCTQLVWEGLENNSRNLIQGGGSLSKSYSGAVRYSLNFIQDPEWTCYKVISVTGEHTKRNIFAHIKNLLSNTIVPISNRTQLHEAIPNLSIKAESIQVNSDDKQGIHMVTIPQGDEGKGRLRGFHPVPRGFDHPKFGPLSRVGAFLDEAEEIPGGVWEDINNILLTETVDNSNVEITAATNPKDRTSRFAQEAEPVDGWASLDIDKSETWKSARGWNVIRLDGARCENVIEGKLVFPGLQTKEGFDNLLKLGINNPEYFTMGRGWFPESSAQAVIINEALFDQAKGRYHFTGATIPFAGVDPAFDGNDHVIYTTGRTGSADGWWDQQDAFHKFPVEKNVIAIEQQFLMPKLRTLEQAKAIMRMSRDMNVKPAWLSTDRTGNGTGLHDALVTMFGDEVLGVMFSWKATDTYILDDDQKVCSEVFHDIISEMAFAVRKFMETDSIKLSPTVNWNDLERQTIGRRYTQVGRGFLRIEDKGTFKKRNSGKSPDRFDSLIIAVNVVRSNGAISAKLVQNPAKANIVRPEAVEHGVVDSLDFLDFSND